MQEKRTQWREDIKPEMAEHFVFLDESSVNVDMTRRYGRSIGQTGVVDKAPLNTPKTTTILSSIRLTG